MGKTVSNRYNWIEKYVVVALEPDVYYGYYYGYNLTQITMIDALLTKLCSITKYYYSIYFYW